MVAAADLPWCTVQYTRTQEVCLSQPQFLLLSLSCPGLKLSCLPQLFKIPFDPYRKMSSNEALGEGGGGGDDEKEEETRKSA
jgi:hypothetical protein